MQQVTNVVGSGTRTCSCGSWLVHWMRFSGQLPPMYCAVVGCLLPPTVGAHVRRGGSGSLEALFDPDTYIVPMCVNHNNQGGATLMIEDSIALVPADASDTCAPR